MLSDGKVSIILPTYNRASLLAQCINSVLRQTYRNIELIICDDCSSDTTEAIIGSIVGENENIIYIRNNARVGLPDNRNIGISNSSGDFVFFIEDDMILSEQCVENLMACYHFKSRRGHNVGGIAPALITSYSSQLKVQSFLNNACRLSNKELKKPCDVCRYTGLRYYNFSPDFNGIQEIPDMHACSFYPKKVLIKVKGYDARCYKGNFLYEETDLNQRITFLGYRFYFQPRAILFHNIIVQGGCRVSTLKYAYYFIVNHLIFLKKNYGMRVLLMAPLFLILCSHIGLKSVIKTMYSTMVV